MPNISNSEYNNKYYKLINEYIEKYIKSHKINPKNLKKYFSNDTKLESFLKRYELNEIVGIKKVVSDVIDDWTHIQSDGIMKFENYLNLNEDLGSINIEKSNSSYERILADLYHTSVGHVNVESESDHKYKVTDFGKEIDVIIYSNEDVLSFKKSLLPILVKNANSNPIDIHKVDVGLESGKEIKTSISFSLSDVCDSEKILEFLNKKVTEKKCIEIIHSFINDYDILRAKKQYVYKTIFKGYHIWEIKERSTITKIM